jgi:hypothetical protein
MATPARTVAETVTGGDILFDAAPRSSLAQALFACRC